SSRAGSHEAQHIPVVSFDGERATRHGLPHPALNDPGPELHCGDIRPPHSDLPYLRECPEQGVSSDPPYALTAVAAQDEELRDVHHLGRACQAGPRPEQRKSDQLLGQLDEVSEVVIPRPPGFVYRELKATASLNPERHMLAKVVGIQ